MSEGKKCYKCGCLKSLSEFHKHKRNRDGHRYICKACSSFYEKERWKKNKRKKSEVKLYETPFYRRLYNQLVITYKINEENIQKWTLTRHE